MLYFDYECVLSNSKEISCPKYVVHVGSTGEMLLLEHENGENFS